MTTYDLEQGLANRAGAMGRAERGLDPQWKEEALAAIRLVAECMPEFTADDVWQTGLDEPSNPKALGNMMLAARRAGIAVKTGRHITTARASRNAGDVAVWQSLVYVTPAQEQGSFGVEQK